MFVHALLLCLTVIFKLDLEWKLHENLRLWCFYCCSFLSYDPLLLLSCSWFFNLLFGWCCHWLGLNVIPGGIVLQRDPVGNETGEGFVEFMTKEDAEKALDRNRQKIQHRWGQITKLILQLMLDRFSLVPRPIPAFQCCILKGGRSQSHMRDVALDRPGTSYRQATKGHPDFK